MTAKPKRLLHHYSGANSTEFWRQVNATKSMALYRQACHLQNVECSILDRIKDDRKRRKESP